ncbi:MAG: hypothetical protein IPK83_13690 [Planctomycetes bacterium]|nr:hypothetical protein [Planctomycetota bacterium]
MKDPIEPPKAAATSNGDDRDAKLKYADSLTRLRRRHRRFYLYFFLAVAAILVADRLGIPAYLTGNGTTSSPWMCLLIFTLPVMLILAFINGALIRCPRCGNPFFLKGGYGNALARRCLHCRLPIK